MTDSETLWTDGTVFGGISEYTGSSAILLSIEDSVLFQQHLCDREPNRRPMMRVNDERSKCDAVSAGASISEVIPACDENILNGYTYVV